MPKKLNERVFGSLDIGTQFLYKNAKHVKTGPFLGDIRPRNCLNIDTRSMVLLPEPTLVEELPNPKNAELMAVIKQLVIRLNSIEKLSMGRLENRNSNTTFTRDEHIFNAIKTLTNIGV